MILFMGGGGELKTRVISVPNFDSLPDEEWQETIALISGYDLGEIYVMNSPPDSPNVGDVHIRPNLSSQLFYKIGNTTIPYSDIYQFNGADWQKMKYYQYIGTEWKTARVYLLDRATEFVPWKIYTWHGGTAAKNENGYLIMGDNFGNQPAAIQTEHRVDLTGFSTLHCFIHNDSAFNTRYVAQVGIQSTQAYSGGGSDGYEGSKVIIDQSAAKTVQGSAGEYDLAVDIAAFDGDYYVGCLSANWYTQVYQIWLEP